MRQVLSCIVTIFKVINNTTPDFDSDQSVVFSLVTVVSRVTYGFRVFLTFSRPGITGKKKAEFVFLMLGILECISEY